MTEAGLRREGTPGPRFSFSSLGGDVQTLRPLFGAVLLGAVWATPALAQRPLGAMDVSRVHSQTVENALQGKVAGAIITANSGAPGGGLQVRMRGVTSVFGNAQPLYVVDGVPVSNTVIQNGLNAVTAASAGRAGTSALQTQDQGVNRIADLNPGDIERIEILKGPSAAAIYGSPAGNGVALITTPPGAPGESRFSDRKSTRLNSSHLVISYAV